MAKSFQNRNVTFGSLINGCLLSGQVVLSILLKSLKTKDGWQSGAGFRVTYILVLSIKERSKSDSITNWQYICSSKVLKSRSFQIAWSQITIEIVSTRLVKRWFCTIVEIENVVCTTFIWQCHWIDWWSLLHICSSQILILKIFYRKTRKTERNAHNTISLAKLNRKWFTARLRESIFYVTLATYLHTFIYWNG